jgi:hypothetical protein
MVDGNAQVIALLERALTQARTRPVRACSLTMVEGISAAIMLTGDTTASAQLNLGLDMLKAVLMQRNVNVYDAVQSDAAPANRVECDLASFPICFDFTCWLAACEMLRRKEGAPAPLDIVFKNAPRYDPTGAKGRFIDNVFRPMLALFNARERPDDGTPCRHVDFQAMREVAALYREGIAVPRLTVSHPREGGYVTITLRETYHHQDRNSDLIAWTAFARWLNTQHERVIVVRDTACADSPLDNLITFETASRDLAVRASLYENAKCNCFVSNGPWSLAAFSLRPWLCFIKLEEVEQVGVNTPGYWRDYMGVNAEGQLPWATLKQRFVYQPDTFENLKSAYGALQ